ncbi:MAG: MBL fold metallo-hydrolase [Chloroflexi bacterium]|nr:MBL fold metallo-hydrolase [Chloroflexota bacterium]MBI3931468.1 MBL fold metallo-hydrolase [Chloroflexota bacterium]
MAKITANVYAETGFRGCNPGFVVTREGVVMIDTPQMPADAIKWRDEIAQYGPVRYLINTEPHGDHFSGNYFFEGTVVGHEGTREAILAASVEQLKERLRQTDPESLALLKDYRYRPPTITLSQRLTLYVGEHTFQLINIPGHTPYQVAVYIPEERVVFTSDNVFYKVQAWLHQALPYQWLDSLKLLEELEADVLVPGHGKLCDRSYIPEMRAFVQDWIDTVKAAIKQGISLEEAQDKISFLDRYPMEGGSEPMGQQVQRWNVARLYEVLQ